MRQSNRIASAESELHLTSIYSTIHVERASNPDFAKLFLKLEAPEKHLTTATEGSQIRGLAWHMVDIMWAVQSAYDNGLLSFAVLDAYKADLGYQMDRWPGIRPHFEFIYESNSSLHDKEIFEPIAAYIASHRVETEE
ncbi:MAG: hypothetical protein IIA07_12960 [Proteobacteria bacterium]|nr:hypothetical protein [Pseudomonadota bacterium]